MPEGTIVERLQSQRTQLVDVVRQLDTAIAAFGGPSTNGNGHQPKAGNHTASWWANATAAQKARRIRKRAATLRQKNRQPAPVGTEIL